MIKQQWVRALQGLVAGAVLVPILTVGSNGNAQAVGARETESSPGIVASTKTTSALKGSDAPTLPSANVAAAGGAPSTATMFTYNTLDAALARSYPNQYGGMNLDDAGSLVVHLVGNSATTSAIESSMASVLAPYEASNLALPVSSIVIAPATASLTTLNAIQQTITSNVQTLRLAGVQLESWGVDIMANDVHVSVNGATAASSATLHALVGLNNLSVSDDGVVTNLYSRQTDTFPWFGGDFISPGQNQAFVCTSGFPISEGGVTFNVTAGHCSAGQSPPVSFNQNGQGYGETYQIQYCSNCSGDFETLTTFPESAAGQVWTGTPTSGSYEQVGGVGLSQIVGEKACFDGYAFERDEGYGSAVCNNIKAFNQCKSVKGTYTCGLTKVGSTSAPPMTEEGDSGRPVYNYFPSTLQALGIIDSGQNCVLGSQAQCIYTIGYFSPEGLIQYDDGADTLCGGAAC